MSKIGNGLILLLLMTLLVSGNAFGQDDMIISITTDKKVVTAGDELTVTFSFSVGDEAKFSLGKLPDFKGFQVIEKKESVKSRFVMGKLLTVMQYKFKLKAPAPKGQKSNITKKIGRAVFYYRDAKYTTRELDIKITPPPKKQPKPKRKPKEVESKKEVPAKKQTKVDSSANKTTEKKQKVETQPVNPKPTQKEVEGKAKRTTPQPPKTVTPPKEEPKKTVNETPPPKEAKKTDEKKPSPTKIIYKSGNLMVKAEVSDPTPYIGAEVIYTFNFYHDLEYRGKPKFGPPKFTSFFAEELPQSRSLEDSKELGGEFIVEEVNYALYPLIAGRVEASSATLDVKAADGSEVTLQTEPLTLNVKSLPAFSSEAGRAYSGSVGEFKIRTKIEGDRIVEGEPFRAIVTIEGEGNISGIAEPQFVNRDDFSYTLVDEKKQLTKGIDGIAGEKVFTYSVTPARAGELTFGGATYIYFDHVKGKYIEITTKKVALTAAKGTKKVAYQNKPFDDFSSLAPLLSPIRVGVTIQKSAPFHKSTLFYSILSLLGFTMFLTLGVSFWRRYEQENKELLKRKRAVSVALDGIEQAHSHLHGKNIEEFYREIHSLLDRFFVARYGVSLIMHSIDSVEGLISGSPKLKGLIGEVTAKIKLLNYFRYSKAEVTEDELKDYLDELKVNIREIGKCKR